MIEFIDYDDFETLECEDDPCSGIFDWNKKREPHYDYGPAERHKYKLFSCF